MASVEEQKVLAKYVGWGGLASAFDEKDKGWKREYKELKDLLTDEEYRSARASTLTSFYTPPFVAGCIHMTLERIGFTGGNILEPAMGTGRFSALCQVHCKTRAFMASSWTALRAVSRRSYTKVRI